MYTINRRWKTAKKECLEKQACVLREGRRTMLSWLSVFSMYGHAGVDERLLDSVE